MFIHRLPVVGNNLAANMTNDAWLFISSSSDPSCCICHLDRNCSIKTLLYPTPLIASFCCQVKNDWFHHPPPHSECVKMDRRTIRAQEFPTIVCALLDRKSSLGTHFAANLTICLLARSPTATSACTLNCCWRRTKKHCFPKNKTTTDRAGLLRTCLCTLNRHVTLKAQPLSLKQCTLVQSKVFMWLCCKDFPCYLRVKCQTFVNRAFSLKRTVWRKGDCYLPNKHTHLGRV